ncbi:hypothetical protein [Sphingobium sp. DN12]|uniref:HORMA-1 domain-containing protein n=1 Tax=Sphingobium sp. DN12 TaxID=3378073 RepID=UPI003DA5AB34
MNTMTRTASASYTSTDVEKVVLRLKADFRMMAESTGAWSLEEADRYAHDVEQLAKKGYLAWVDVTHLYGTTELQAVKYHVDTDAGSLTSSRPGGVRWDKVSGAWLRVVLRYTADYDADAKDAMKNKLKVLWSPTTDDTSHTSLSGGDGRNYTSNSFGLQRKDWKK